MRKMEIWLEGICELERAEPLPTSKQDDLWIRNQQPPLRDANLYAIPTMRLEKGKEQ